MNKEVIKYAQVLGEIKVGEGVIYVYDADANGSPEEYDGLRGLTSPVISYDEATETFETKDGIYAPA